MGEKTAMNAGRRAFLRDGTAIAGASVALTPAAALGGGPDEKCIELPPADAETFNITCQYCMVQCGYKVRVWERGKGRTPKDDYATVLSGEWISPSFVVPAEKGGKKVFIAVVPDKDCVVNAGDHSVRGGTNAQTLFSRNLPSAKKRLTQPLIRKGGKGTPLVPVSWEEAISFTAKKLTALKNEFGPDSLGLIGGDWLYNLPTYAMLKFWFTGVGSSSHAGNGWFYDEESSGISAAFGSGRRSFTEEDFELTKLLVTAGTNVEANGSVWYHRFYQKNLSAGKAKHIDIDPRRTYQSGIAEKHGGLHLQIKPGTDAILFAAMIREILKRDGYDKEFVSANVAGFDVVREVVQDERFTIENAAKVTWVPADKITRAVDLLIESKGQTMLLNEKGIMHQMGAFEHQHAMAVLGVILGNAGKPGACTSRAGGHPGGTLVDSPEPPSRKDNAYIYDALQQGKIKAIWAFGCNIFKQMPSLTKFRPLMEKTFLVVQDRIHTEMDEAADVIFPAATWGETDLMLTSVTRRLRVLQKFMDPPGQAKPDWWIVAQVAKAMGLKGYEWGSPIEIWDEMRKKDDGLRDITWDMLLKAGTNGVRTPYLGGKEGPARAYSDEWAQHTGKRFSTKDDKVHVEKFAAIKKFDPAAYEWGEVDGKYPLMAIDFRLNELWNTGYTYWDKPTVNQRTPDAFLMIHPEDAAPRKIKDGAWVTLKSPYGSCKAKARVTKDINQGVVGIPALFPKKGQEFNFATRPHASPVNGDFDTMVACDVTMS